MIWPQKVAPCPPLKNGACVIGNLESSSYTFLPLHLLRLLHLLLPNNPLGDLPPSLSPSQRHLVPTLGINKCKCLSFPGEAFLGLELLGCMKAQVISLKENVWNWSNWLRVSKFRDIRPVCKNDNDISKWVQIGGSAVIIEILPSLNENSSSEPLQSIHQRRRELDENWDWLWILVAPHCCCWGRIIFTRIKQHFKSSKNFVLFVWFHTMKKHEFMLKKVETEKTNEIYFWKLHILLPLNRKQ